MDRALNILFLCTHNSARSILAEALLNHLDGQRFLGHSAGSQPKGAPNPLALKVLAAAGIDITPLRSKGWDEFATPAAPAMDAVITVCDQAAGETCPYWPGQPATAHWGYPDPSDAPGGEAAREDAFRLTLLALRRRLQLLINLPPEQFKGLALQQTLRSLAQE